jgi:flagellar basal-body rod modification protein FlgD
MTVGATGSATSNTNNTPQTPTTTNSASTLDYNSFLKLLTAQMKFQDPTKPTDATAFVSQLASFSSVEQGIKTNQKLDALVTEFALSQADGLIGKTVTSADGSISGKVASVRIYSDGAQAILEDGRSVNMEAGVVITNPTTETPEA